MNCWICRVVKKYGAALIIGFMAAVMLFAAVNEIIKPFSTSQYCGSKCHEMQTAYRSWKLSEHGSNKYGLRIECVDCHLPPEDKYFTHIAVKGYEGLKDIYKHHFGESYDAERMRQKVLETMPNENCLKCHNDLSTRPATSGAHLAHRKALNSSSDLKLKCVQCHEHLHERIKKIFPVN